jgi:hypothetical protein
VLLLLLLLPPAAASMAPADTGRLLLKDPAGGRGSAVGDSRSGHKGAEPSALDRGPVALRGLKLRQARHDGQGG